MDWLGINPILADLGFNGIQRAAVAGSLIGRMAAPGSELATWRWLGERSALGELLRGRFGIRVKTGHKPERGRIGGCPRRLTFLDAGRNFLLR